jgi:pimeloyl-ACP methyl ester carboxylesterase
MANLVLHHTVKGDGPAVVLLHEGVADGRMWSPQVDALSRRYRVVVPDFRGYGQSPLPPERFRHVDDVVALLDGLGVERVAAAGASLGARVALELALTVPERVWALVLVAPGLSGVEWSEEVRAGWAAEEAALEAGDIDEAVEINLRMWVDGPRRGPDEVDPAVRAHVGEMQRRALEVQIPAYADPGHQPAEDPLDPPASARLAEVSVPTLVLVGDLDQPDIVSTAGRLAAEIPEARHAVIEGTAHVPNLERPGQVSELLLEFLDSQSERVIA